MNLTVIIALIALFIGIFILVATLLPSKKNAIEERLGEIRTMNGETAEDDKQTQNNQRERLASKLSFIKVPENVEKTIRESGIELKVEEFVLLWIILIFLPSALYFFVSKNFIVAFIIAIVCAVLPPLLLSSKRKKQLEAFEVELSDVLMLISNSLRAGFSFEQAFEVAAKDSKDPLSKEFLRSLREIRMGVPMDKALYGIVDRTGSMNMKLVVSAVIVQRQVGGNLADILDGISDTIRDRIEMKKNIKTLTAQGRFSGLIIGMLPIGLFFLVSLINPGYMSVFTANPIGIVLLIICLTFEGIGALVIRKMVNIDV